MGRECIGDQSSWVLVLAPSIHNLGLDFTDELTAQEGKGPVQGNPISQSQPEIASGYQFLVQ